MFLVSSLLFCSSMLEANEYIYEAFGVAFLVLFRRRKADFGKNGYFNHLNPMLYSQYCALPIF